jgi:hypothetical protein
VQLPGRPERDRRNWSVISSFLRQWNQVGTEHNIYSCKTNKGFLESVFFHTDFEMQSLEFRNYYPICNLAFEFVFLYVILELTHTAVQDRHCTYNVTSRRVRVRMMFIPSWLSKQPDAVSLEKSASVPI